MKRNKTFNIIAGGIVIIPVIILYYLLTYHNLVLMNGDVHFYLVSFSSLIAFYISISAYREYKKTNIAKLYFISLGFIGLAVIYSFHAFITPNMTLFTLFQFPDIKCNISMFMLFGDSSRLWLALMLILPDNLFEYNRKIKKILNGKTIIIVGIFIFLISLIVLLNPEVIPNLKTDTGVDTYSAVLLKVAILLFLGISTLKYYYSYSAKPNLSILSIVVGLVLIMETTVFFNISKAWSSAWWLAHDLFLLSFVAIGAGIVYSHLSENKICYFDVLGQVKNYVRLLEESNQKLITLANHDILTGLPNRNAFYDFLNQYISTENHDELKAGILFIDIDGFKQVNDRYGHDIGDTVLKIVAQKIKSCIKQNDVASRIGGDEFVALVKDVNEEQLCQISKRLIDRLNEPIAIDNNNCCIGASIGVSILPDHGTTAEELVRKSDEAMYFVKKQGKNGYKIAR